MKKYYCIKQHDITDCGAACLATISKQYGFTTSITKIREVAGTDKQGTNAYGVIKAAEQLGFSAKGVKGDEKALFSEFPLPCIAHVVVNGSLLHYVVIHSISQKQIVIADPAKGIIKLSPQAFLGRERNGEKPPEYQWTGILILMTPDVKFQKGSESKGIFQRFFHLLIPQKRLIMHIFIASLLFTALGILGAFYFKLLVDEIMPGGLEKTLLIISIGVVLLNLFRVLLNALRSHLLLYLSQKLDIALLLGYYRHVLELPMNFFGTRKVGEIISRFNDASKVRDAISGATLTVMIDTLMVIGGGVILYIQSGRLFLITFLIVIMYAAIVFSFNKTYRRKNEKQMEDNAQLTSYMVESLNGIQTIKAYNAERRVKLETETKFIRLLRSIFQLTLASNVQSSLVSFIELTGGTIILWVGAYQVIKGQMTMGELITYHSLLAYFLDPMKNLINLQPQMQTAIVASDRLGEILELELERTEKEMRKACPENLKGDIRLEQITFRYGTRAPVINNLSMCIPCGAKVAFVGESGSGKTTLAKLLLHFYDPEKGDVLIKDRNVKDITLDCLRDRIAYIPQETFLFSGTILENLVLGLDNYTLDEVLQACQKAQAHEFINHLPLRYDTMLEENGANLSGGQRQRLAIARAILRKPDILILDEATSNLDTITEQAISATIEDYAKDMTTIIVAHRLSTIRHCDRIFVMEQGTVIEQGSHEELLEHNGTYAELWKRQIQIV